MLTSWILNKQLWNTIHVLITVFTVLQRVPYCHTDMYEINTCTKNSSVSPTLYLYAVAIFVCFSFAVVVAVVCLPFLEGGGGGGLF